jgi:hypothetical protein
LFFIYLFGALFLMYLLCDSFVCILFVEQTWVV